MNGLEEMRCLMIRNTEEEIHMNMKTLSDIFSNSGGDEEYNYFLVQDFHGENY